MSADMLAGGAPPTGWDGLEKACGDANEERGGVSLKEIVEAFGAPVAGLER